MQLKSGFTGVRTEKKEDGTRAGTDFGFSPAAVTGLIGGICGRRLVKSEAPVWWDPKSGGARGCSEFSQLDPCFGVGWIVQNLVRLKSSILDYQRQHLTDLEGG
jgi:hypothetical protein